MSEEACDDKLGIKIQRRKKSISNRNLLIAAFEGDVFGIRNCIEQGADIEFVDRDGNTPLHYAIQSKNVDIVRYFVEYLKDINVENYECKTPLDISIAIKQNDYIELLSMKNLIKSTEILNKEAGQHQDTENEISFMEGTFNNYVKTLSKEDIQNILDFKYFRRNGKKVFKAIAIKVDLENIHESAKDIENEIEKFTENKKTTTLILNLGWREWFTLVFYYANEDNEDHFKVYCYNSHEDLLPDIKDLICRKGIEFRHSKHNELILTRDSGISALKFAEEFDPFSEENKVIKVLKDLNEDEEREFYANILMEKKRVEDKIKVCFETLQNLNKNESDVKELNYKNANVFINFLEAFALQDTLPKMSKNVRTQDEKEKITKRLQVLKKDYFNSYYFQEEKKKSDFDLITCARNIVLHSGRLKEPQDFKVFIKGKNSVCNFFKDLEKYTGKIKEKIEKKLTKIDGEIHCHEFLTSSRITSLKEGELGDIRDFLLEIYKPDAEIKQDKTIFKLIVNIFPIIDKKKEKVRSLSVTRNNLVHNYQEKSILNNEKKFKEIQELCSLRFDLFNFFYSQEVHELLSKIIDKDIETLQDDFQKILDDFQKEIIKKEESIRISGEPSKNFDCCYIKPLFPEKDEIIDVVDKYLKYAFIVDKKAGTKEKCTKLTDDKKRDLIEDFMKLKKNQESTPAKCQNERENLKNKLNMYGLDKNGFDRVVGYYLDDSVELPGENIKKRDKIIEIISSLKQIQKKYSFFNSIIIKFYEKVLELKKKGFTTCKNYYSEFHEIFIKSKLTIGQRKIILQTLRNFPGVETIDVKIGEEKFCELNTFDVIRNIFVFFSSYDKFKLEMNNVEEAFNNDTFLHYLFNCIEKEENSKSFKDRYFVCVLIKKLITIEYASPCIAKLLYESNDDRVIDKNDFINLLGTLLQKNAYVKHLAKLLNLKSKKFDVYGEFCDQILDKSFDIENIRYILKDPNHAKSILNKLSFKIKNFKKNYLMEDEATKIEEFYKKIKHFNIDNVHNIFQDCNEVKVILLKLIANIENVKTEHSFEINVKKVREFLERKLTVTNLQEEFQTNNITEILCNLNDKVRKREVNYGKEKSIKAIENVTQQILKQLNIITYELHRDNCYEDVVKILGASIEASKKLKQNDALKNISLDAEFRKAWSMIRLADMKRNKNKMRKALRISHRIKNKLDRNVKFLLISSEIARAERLLKKFEKSYQSYETLFKNIAINISNNEFSELENSKEYQKMLTIYDEAKMYLSITHIQIYMAYNKRCIGSKLWRKGRNEKAFNNLKEAIQILEKLYSFRKKSLKNTLDTEKRTELANISLKIANTKYEIGKFYDKKNALQHFREALVKCIQCSESLKDIYSSFHPSYKACISLMQSIVYNKKLEIKVLKNELKTKRNLSFDYTSFVMILLLLMNLHCTYFLVKLLYQAR